MGIKGYSNIKKIMEAGTADIYIVVKKNVEYILKITKAPYNFNNKLILNEYDFFQKFDIKHTPTIIEKINIDDRIGLIMTRLKGLSLQYLVEYGYEFDDKEILLILKQVSIIIKDLHKNKIIYRDLKPSNIIYDFKDKKISICDFGTVYFETSILGNKPIGTIGFASPEQFERTGLTEDVDIFAIGSLAVYLKTAGKNIYTVNKKIMMKKIKSKKLKNLIHCSTHNEIKNRYNSIEQLIIDLETNHYDFKFNKIFG